jgi:hypothetical protein
MGAGLVGRGRTAWLRRLRTEQRALECLEYGEIVIRTG